MQSYNLIIIENDKEYSVKINTSLDMSVVNNVADAYILQKHPRYFKSWVNCIMNGHYRINQVL